MAQPDDEIIDGLLPDESHNHLDRLPYGRHVGALLSRPGALNHWRQRCQESYQEHRGRHKRLEAWTRCQEEDEPEPYVGGPLPLSVCRTLSLADSYLLLALIHDADRRDAGHICLFSPSEEGGTFFEAQRARVAELRESDQLTLNECLDRVKADLLTSTANLPPRPIPSKQAQAVTPDAPSEPDIRTVAPDTFVYGDKRVAHLSAQQWRLLDALCNDGKALDAIQLDEVACHVWQGHLTPGDWKGRLKSLRKRTQEKLDVGLIGLKIDRSNETLRLIPG